MVKTWTEGPGTSCPTPTVNPSIPYTYNSATQLCERDLINCPGNVGGFGGNPGTIFSPISFPDSICTNGCVAHKLSESSIFGIFMTRYQSQPMLCIAQPTPPPEMPSVVVIAPDAPDVTRFDDVVAKAAAVDAARTEQARQDAYIAKVVADGLKAKMAADKAAAEAALQAQKDALRDVKRKGAEVLANPTTTNINNYNNAVNIYNNTTSTVNNILTTLQSDWTTSQAGKNNADSNQVDSQAISAQIQGLKDAIAASGQPFNPTEVQQKTTGDTALNDQLAASAAALADAAAQLSAAAALLTQAGKDLADATKALGDLAGAIKRLLEGLPACVSNPNDPACKPVLPFCVEHPNDASCKLQPPLDCTVTPNAPGCKPVVDCKMTPNVPQCMAASAVNACELNPLSAGCAELGEVKDDVPLEEKTININTITPVSVGGAGACPAPAQLTFHGKTYYSSYETYCNFALGIKPIIIAFAWLAAAGILIGGFRTA